MKRSVCIIAMLLCMVMLFSACDSGTTPGGDTTTPAGSDSSSASIEDNTDPSGDDERIVLIKDGVSYYSIVRADDMESSLLDAILEFRTNWNTVYGTNMTIKSDWSVETKDIAIVDNNEYEILIGATNRRESVDTLAQLRENQYVVKYVGNKLVIIGYDDYATRDALNQFIIHCGDYADNMDGVSIRADIKLTGTSSVQKELLSDGADIRIMTYNLAGTSKEWNTRKDYIPESILHYLPDVIGFQECNSSVHSVLSSKQMKKYYAINVQKHSDNSTFNYTPILYRSDLYTKLEAGVEFLDQRYKGTNTKSLSWVVLERKADGQRFIVINMHGALWTTSYPIPSGETYASMRTKAQSWRVDNARQMLEKISELQTKYGSIPAFTTGDYNFNKNAEAYATMKTTGLSSSQETAPQSSTGGSYHDTVGAKPDASGLPIDHIFYFADISEAYTYKICTTKTDINASDHCPVYADFKLVK